MAVVITDGSVRVRGSLCTLLARHDDGLHSQRGFEHEAAKELAMTGVDTALRDSVFELIEADRELLAETCLELGNTYGPCGHEQPVADAVSAWYGRHGIAARQQQILLDRSNVVAVLPGSKPGAASLIFNAHLDTEISGPDHANLMESGDPNLVGAWREGDRILGHTVLNDRDCMSVFMVMARALAGAGARLGGDVILTSAVGETGMAPVDEYQGLSYEGKGFGTRHLVDHGVRAVARSVDPAAEVECYMAKAGRAGTGVEPLSDAVEEAYGEIVGSATPPPQTAHTSMWRDTNIFNAVGIPSLTFGPPRGSAAV